MPTGENITVDAGKKTFWSTPMGQATMAGIIILFIVIGVGIYFYEKGKSATKQATLPANDSAGNNLTDAQILQIASSLHGDMAGISWFGDHDEDLFNSALALSNYDFVRLYNIYNTEYQQADNKTLYAMIEACIAIPGTEWSTTKDAMIQKLAANNITS